MLMRIAGRYDDLRRTNKEYAVELQAEAIARHARDIRLLLNVQCNTVETEVMLGGARRAGVDQDADAYAASDCADVDLR